MLFVWTINWENIEWPIWVSTTWASLTVCNYRELFFSSFFPVILVWPCGLPGGPWLACFTFTALWHMHLHYWDFNSLLLSWDKSRKWALQTAHKNPQKKIRRKISVRGAFSCCLKSIWTDAAGSGGSFIRNGTKNEKKKSAGIFSVTKTKQNWRRFNLHSGVEYCDSPKGDCLY